MSHRIIEKRRRDRMNNCLADLSRLIPPDYLKKGRGRIEKTEIIEMAIKHMRHLQSIISSSRINEVQCENPASSPQNRNSNRDFGIPGTPTHQPIIMEHYRLGYLECLSEAMHFLVEVQGYFAGDSLCVQMINHLHKHCDKILKSDSLNHPRKHSGETTSNSSSSPRNGNYSNNSPPLGLSVSNGSNSDDNQLNPPYEGGRAFESTGDRMRIAHVGFRSPRRYSDLSSRETKKNCESYYLRYSEMENERVSENPSDSDLEQGFCTSGRSKEGKNYVNGCDDSPKCIGGELPPKNCSSSSGIGSNTEVLMTYDELIIKDENGSSQLRDMLMSPKAIHLNHGSGINSIPTSNIKRSGTPIAQVLAYQPSSDRQNPNLQDLGAPGELSHCSTDVFNCRAQNSNIEAEDCVPPEVYHHQNPFNFESSGGDNHSNMYKFKNNIKQRFSKERRNHESDDDNSSKKIKLNDSSRKNVCQETSETDGSGMKHSNDRVVITERVDLLNRVEEECESRKKNRYLSESEIQIESEIENISNRLSFGHKTSHRFKKWDENVKFSKLKLSPPYFNPETSIECKAPENGRRPIDLLTITDYLPSEPALLRKCAKDMNEQNGGIPIFALHSKAMAPS